MPTSRYSADKQMNQLIDQEAPTVNGRMLASAGDLSDTGVHWEGSPDSTVIRLAIYGNHIITVGQMRALMQYAESCLGVKIAPIMGNPYA